MNTSQPATPQYLQCAASLISAWRKKDAQQLASTLAPELAQYDAQLQVQIMAQTIALLTSSSSTAGSDTLFIPLLDALRDEALTLLEDYASLLSLEGKLVESLNLFSALADQQPESEELKVKIALRHQWLGEHALAAAILEEVLASSPENAEARLNLSLLEMMQSGFAKGLDDYETRFTLGPENWHDLPRPRWEGETLAGKSLLLWSEQGIGDITMFLSLLPWALAQSPARITLAVPARMKALIERSYPECEFIIQDTKIHLPEGFSTDFASPMGDLMRHALPHFKPADHEPFFKADPTMVAEAKAALERLGSARKIGFAWETTNAKTAMLRSIPLTQWEQVFSVPNCVFFSLQHGDNPASEVSTIQQQTGWPLLADPGLNAIKQIDALAALIMALDEVITIQNAVAHLAGALGKPTTLLLPAASDFRWLKDRDDSIWYRSVNIVRQKEAMNWEKELAEVAGELRQRVKSGS